MPATGRAVWPISLILTVSAVAQDQRLVPILERLSEEAEVFLRNAPKAIGQERLLHRGEKVPAFKLMSKGKDPGTPETNAVIEREIVSEYGFGSFKEAPEAIREFRQTLSVDGKASKGAEKARLTLAQNMTSDDDRQRKRMLEDFEKLGMVGAATDFGQMILLFRRGGLDKLHFNYKAPAKLGTDDVDVLQWYQRDDADSARVYQGKEMVRIRMQGEIWSRQSDHVPLRITVLIPAVEYKQPVTHEGEIDYYQSAHGVLLPAAVRYKKISQKRVVIENYAFYTKYRMFKVDAEIKFTAEENLPGPTLAGPPQ